MSAASTATLGYPRLRPRRDDRERIVDRLRATWSLVRERIARWRVQRRQLRRLEEMYR